MKVKLDKLASFRINSERWEKFKEIAETQNKTATDLLNEYIDRVIGVGVADSPNAPKISIRDIDKRIDAKITTSIQDIDNAVKQLIANSLEDGIIGDAIAKLQRKFSDENNELQSQIYALQQTLNDLKQELLSKIDNIPQSSSDVPSPQSPVTSPKSPNPNNQQINEDQKIEIIELLGLGGIVNGEVYYQQLLIDTGIDSRIDTNKGKLEAVGISFSKKLNTPVGRLNHVLTSLGFRAENKGQKTINGKRGIECYQVRL